MKGRREWSQSHLTLWEHSAPRCQQPQRSSLRSQNSPEVGLLHCLRMEKLRHKGPSHLPMEGSGSCFKPPLPQLNLQGPGGPADYNLGLCMSWAPVRMALQ